MELITASLGFFGALLACRAKPGQALGILIALTLLWPEYLRVPIGPIQMSVPRMIAFAIVFVTIVTGGKRNFRFSSPDGAVIFLYLWVIFAQIAAGASIKSVGTYIGQGFDTVLMYFVARYCVQTREDLTDSTGWIAVACIVMGVFGVIEMVTMWSPWSGLYRYKDFVLIEGGGPRMRMGMMRAKGPTAVYIYFGLSMALLFSILYAVRSSGSYGSSKQKLLLGIGMLGAALAVLSTLSSGPWLMFGMFISCFFFYRYPRFIRPVIYLGIAGLFCIEIFSNRHFYHLIDYISLDKQTAWYRARLLEVASAHINEWWLIGVGSKPLLHWAAELDGRGHLDIVNHYIWLGVSGGLPAIVALVFIQVRVIKNAILFWRLSDPKIDRIGFSVLAMTLAVMFAMNTVSFFGPSTIFCYILYGILPALSSNKGRAIERLNQFVSRA